MAADPTKPGRVSRELLFAAFTGPAAETEDPRTLERLTAAVVAETVAAGHVLFREGDESVDVHFMSEGRMRLSRTGYPDWVYEGRWVVGTTDVLVGRRRSRTAVMETDATLFRLPANVWYEAVDNRRYVLAKTLVGFARGITARYAQLAPDGGFPPPAAAQSLDVSSLAARVRLLASTPLLRGLPVQSLLELAHLAERRDLAPEETLFTADAPPARVFVVSGGRIEARRGEPTVSATFGPGSIVGGAVCLSDAEAAWSARALERAQVLSFTTESLFDHIEEHRNGARAMMGALAVEQERACEVLAARRGELVLR
jgi:CRP-like cAMP-binding protein